MYRPKTLFSTLIGAPIGIKKVSKLNTEKAEVKDSPAPSKDINSRKGSQPTMNKSNGKEVTKEKNKTKKSTATSKKD